MDPILAGQYDSVRNLTGKQVKAACYAPFVSLFFNCWGQVRACCVNHSYTLGSIASSRLPEIWSGENIRLLREAMKNYDFSLGCELCEWQINDGNFQAADANYLSLHAMKYDHFPMEDDALYPTNLEFNLANTCNLECVMCNGTFSSSIRSRREKLPPLPRVYKEEFFEDLRDFLPHVRGAQFLGGEPFLVVEHFQVWDLMIEMGLPISCHVTTNGTQWNDKVVRVLESMPFTVSISMDGASKDTFEKIRLNAKYDEVVKNVGRFREYTNRKGTRLAFSFTLMTENWHELGDFLLFADSWDAGVSVCTLTYPDQYNVYKLPTDKLREVVETLDRQAIDVVPKLGRNRGVFQNVLNNLRHRLEHKEKGETTFFDNDPKATNFRPAWHVDLEHATSVKGGKLHAVRFRARADQPRMLDVAVSQNHEPWQHLGFYRHVQVGKEWKNYSFEFVGSATDEKARLRFLAGQDTTPVEVADASLEMVTKEKAAPKPFARDSFRLRLKESDLAELSLPESDPDALRLTFTRQLQDAAAAQNGLEVITL